VPDELGDVLGRWKLAERQLDSRKMQPANPMRGLRSDRLDLDERGPSLPSPSLLARTGLLPKLVQPLLKRPEADALTLAERRLRQAASLESPNHELPVLSAIPSCHSASLPAPTDTRQWSQAERLRIHCWGDEEDDDGHCDVPQ
jgi:hypothetical protein